jgi:hypothetical protein
MDAFAVAAADNNGSKQIRSLTPGGVSVAVRMMNTDVGKAIS